MRFSIAAIAVLAASLVVALPAGPALAEKGAPAQAPAAPPPLGQDALSQATGRLLEASTVYKDLVLESEDLMELAIDGSTRAANAKNPPSREWLAGWKAQIAAKSASVRARRDALPPFPRDAFKAFGSNPELRRMTDGLAELPKTSTMVANTMLDLSAEITPLVEAAVGGDAAARLRLVGESTKGASAALKAENALLDLSINTGMSAHPQTALSRSIKASNEALGLLLDYLSSALDNGGGDSNAMLRDVQAKLEECRSEARKVGPTARFMGQSLVGQPIPAALKTRLDIALATYDESGKVELQIADVLEKGIADLLSDPEASNGLDNDLQPLVNRRLVLQNQRLAAFTQ